MRTTVHRCLTTIALALGVPALTVAQAVPGFNLTIEGTRQGLFPGGKGGAIPGVRFAYGVIAPRDASTGMLSGRRVHSPVVVTKLVGTASPQLLQALITNESLKSVVVDLPGDEGGIGYTVKLGNAAITEIRQRSETADGRFVLLEDVSFVFQSIEVQDPVTRTMAMDNISAR
jgi:type VI secretion system secreted protein Hcp